MASRTKKSVINMASGVVAQVVTLLLSFVTRTIFIHFLSTEYLGINGLLTNILTVLSFAELGIGEAMTYAMYKPAKEENHVLMIQLLQLYKKAYTCIAFVVALIGLILSFFLDVFVSEPPHIPESLQIIFWLYVLNNVCSYLLTYKKSILIAYQDTYVITAFQQAFSVTQQIFQMFVLFMTHQYYLYLIVQVVCTVANNVAISCYVSKKFNWIKDVKPRDLPRESVKIIYRDVRALSISKIAGVVSNGADNIIISKLLGLTSVGLVSNYTLIINSLNAVLWRGLTGITCSFGNFNVDSTLERKNALFDELYLCAYWLYALLCIGLMTLINPFILLWLGDEYTVSQPVVLALVLIIYVGGLNFPLYTYRITLGMFDEVKWAFLASGILNIIFSIVFGLKYGLIGIYLATSISRLCTSEIADGYCVYKYGLEKPAWKYGIRYFCYFVLTIGAYAATDFCVSLIKADGVVGFVIKTVMCVFVCNIIFLIVFCRTVAFKNLYKRVLTFIKKR